MERRTLLVVLLVCSFLMLATVADASPWRSIHYRPRPRPLPPKFPGPGCVCVKAPCLCDTYG